MPPPTPPDAEGPDHDGDHRTRSRRRGGPSTLPSSRRPSPRSTSTGTPTSASSGWPNERGPARRRYTGAGRARSRWCWLPSTTSCPIPRCTRHREPARGSAGAAGSAASCSPGRQESRSAAWSVKPCGIPGSPASSAATPAAAAWPRCGRCCARAMERGELPPEAITARQLEAGLSVMRFHFLVNGAPVADAVIVEIVDEVVLPLFRAAASVERLSD